MKLYTEEEIKKRLLSLNVTNTDIFIDLLKPIELPSNEEIDEYLNSKYFADKAHRVWFNLGAKWMKEQILNQNK